MNTPSDNLKMLLIGLLALSVLGFFCPSGVSAYSSAIYQDIQIHADGVGLYLTFTPTVDFTINWDARAGHWMPDSPYNYNYIYWGTPDNWDYADYAPPLEKIGQANENGNINLSIDYKAGQTYKRYLFQARTPYGQRELPTGLNYEELKAQEVAQPGDYPFTFDNNTSYTLRADIDGTEYDTQGTFAPLPKASINEPIAGSELDAPFDLSYDYENGEGYAYAIFYMEQENQNGDPIYSYQALEPIATSTATGTVNFTLPDSQTEELAKGYYNDCKCLLQKYDGTKTQNLCPDYELTVLTGSRVTLPPPEWEEISTSTAEDFYEQHSDYATATPAFDVIFESIEPFYGWTNNIAEQFAGQFDPADARERGEEMGDAVVKARAYADSLNAFFGGLPVAWILLFYVITALALTVFKLIYRLVDLIKP